MTNTIQTVSRQWATRPDDERYTSLFDLADHYKEQRTQCREVAVPQTSMLLVQPDGDELTVYGPNRAVGYTPTNWAFNQLCDAADAPPSYMRRLPPALAATCLNNGLQDARKPVQVLLQKNGSSVLRAINSPSYGRVWSSEIAHALVDRFGDGVSGDWRVPGEFGKRVPVTKANTTIYGSDRDLFVFLCDETNKIEMPDRRNGETGLLSRGFYVWNSDVGARTLGIAAFLFDYVCANRIIWGVEGFKQVKIRHSLNAPARWIDDVQPVLDTYRTAPAIPVQTKLLEAQKTTVDPLKVLTGLYNAKTATRMLAAYDADEHRPAETLWDTVTAMTAYARSLPHQDVRVAIEQAAGKLLASV